jgi:DNA-binding NarL/FixJ family response regulator
LRTLLAERDDLTIVGEASSVEEASPRLSDVDVILAALAIDSTDGLTSPAEPVASQSIPTLLLGGDPTPTDIARLIQGPVRGLLSADATADEIGAALTAVAHGMVVMEPRIGRLLASTIPAEHVGEATGDEQLTEREHEVLQLVAQGLPNKTIASRLKISEHTVKFHVGSILAKLDAGSRTEAVTRAARRGWLTL